MHYVTYSIKDDQIHVVFLSGFKNKPIKAEGCCAEVAYRKWCVKGVFLLEVLSLRIVSLAAGETEESDLFRLKYARTPQRQAEFGSVFILLVPISFWCGYISTTTSAICLGTRSRMSLVRMCMVTVSLFRVCMCMCLRARERERREAATRASETELAPILEAGDLALRITTEHVQVNEKNLHTTSVLDLSSVVQADDLKSNVGPYSPKRQLADCKESLQDKFTHRHLRTGLQWLSNSIDEHREEFLNCLANQLVGQEEPPVIEEESEEADRQLIFSTVEPPTPTLTIAWSEGDSCVIGSPPYTAYHHEQIADGRHSVEMAGVDEKPKTLVDELLETDKTTYTHGECLSEFRGSCECSQLPNQILATLTSACTIKIWIEDDLKDALTAGEAGEQVTTRPRS